MLKLIINLNKLEKCKNLKNRYIKYILNKNGIQKENV